MGSKESLVDESRRWYGGADPVLDAKMSCVYRGKDTLITLDHGLFPRKRGGVEGCDDNIKEACLPHLLPPCSTQGAVMSLRVVAEGSAAVIFVQVFAVGTSIGFPQVPFFLAAGISLVGLAVRDAVGVRAHLRNCRNTKGNAASAER